MLVFFWKTLIFKQRIKHVIYGDDFIYLLILTITFLLCDIAPWADCSLDQKQRQK